MTTAKIERPFENESEVALLGGLTIENRLDRISIGGLLDITADEAGLAAVGSLLGILEPAMRKLTAMKSAGKLPSAIEISQPSAQRDPFA